MGLAAEVGGIRVDEEAGRWAEVYLQVLKLGHSTTVIMAAENPAGSAVGGKYLDQGVRFLQGVLSVHEPYPHRNGWVMHNDIGIRVLY